MAVQITTRRIPKSRLPGALLLGLLAFSSLGRAAELPPDPFAAAAEPLRLAALVEEEKRPQRAPLDEAGREKLNTGWALYVDNDLFAPGGHDRDYTGGVSLTLSGARARDYWFSADPVLGGVDGWLGVDDGRRLVLHSFETGMTAFTPEDIQTETPLADDRPYASLVYVSNSRIYIEPWRQRGVISTFTLGVLGLDAVGEFQNALHSAFDGDEANGWDNQIADGGEPTLRYAVARQTVHAARYGPRQRGYEIKTSLQGSLGYLTDASWGVSARVGRLRTPWWSFNPQLSEYAEKSTPLGVTGASGSGDELYLWGGFNVRLRLYNAFLQGQLRDSAVTYDYDELHHVIGEGWLGLTQEFGNGLRLSYFLRAQTAEIKSGPGSRNPVWGGIIISRAY